MMGPMAMAHFTLYKFSNNERWIIDEHLKTEKCYFDINILMSNTALFDNYEYFLYLYKLCKIRNKRDKEKLQILAIWTS